VSGYYFGKTLDKQRASWLKKYFLYSH
jgi:hypothetical protein